MDLTIQNPNIRAYLTGRSTIPPVKELRYMFENPVEIKDGTILDDVKKRIVVATQKAIKLEKRTFPSDEVTKNLVLLVNCFELFRLGAPEAEKKEALQEAALALKSLWQISERV